MGVDLKALEWSDDPPNTVDEWSVSSIAHSPFGSWRVSCMRGVFPGSPEKAYDARLMGKSWQADAPSNKEAKVACQAEYERRVLACIRAPAPTQEGGLVEALRGVLEIARDRAKQEFERDNFSDVGVALTHFVGAVEEACPAARAVSKAGAA